MSEISADIAVIGGGASGLAAAIAAKSVNRGLRVIIAERLPRTGKKLLSTGNGRCNLGNRELSPENYHGTVDAMGYISRAPRAEELFRSLGVLTVCDSAGRLYPHSGSAATVLSALRMRAEELGAEERCGAEITGILPQKGRYALDTAAGDRILCTRVIIAAGAYADPKSGTDGRMLGILRKMGYKTAECTPAVAPLRTSPELLKGLKGVRAKCRISAAAGGKTLRTETGELQFTEQMLSGICVFDLAYLWGKYGTGLTVSADLVPELERDELERYLEQVGAMHSRQPVSELLTGLFRRELAAYIIKRAADKPLSAEIRSLKRQELSAAARYCKDLRFPVTGAAGWQNAQSTFGGVVQSEVGDDLQSKRHRGLYLCGEILDTVGDCGGYNLQWAWTSGTIAGREAAVFKKK